MTAHSTTLHTNTLNDAQHKHSSIVSVRLLPSDLFPLSLCLLSPLPCCSRMWAGPQYLLVYLMVAFPDFPVSSSSSLPESSGASRKFSFVLVINAVCISFSSLDALSCDARALVCLSNDQIVILLEASECSTMVASNVRSELVCLEHQQLVFGLCYGCLNWLGTGVLAGEFRLLDLKEVPLVSKGLDLVLASEEVSISSPASA